MHPQARAALTLVARVARTTLRTHREVPLSTPEPRVQLRSVAEAALADALERVMRREACGETALVARLRLVRERIEDLEGVDRDEPTPGQG